MSGFIFYILNGLFSLITLVLFLTAIMSLLISFNIINTRNSGVNMVYGWLRMVADPVVAPFRMIIPNLGGLDLSFLLAYLVIRGMQIYLFPYAEETLRGLIG